MNFPMDGHACPLKFGSCECVFLLSLTGLTDGVTLKSPLCHRVTDHLTRSQFEMSQWFIEVPFILFFFFCSWKEKHFNKALHLSCLDAYPISEIVYTWKKGPLSSVEVPEESSSLLQYDLIGQTVSSERLKSNTGEQKSFLIGTMHSFDTRALSQFNSIYWTHYRFKAAQRIFCNF